MKEPLENPFVFGEIVDKKRFVNREAELEQLTRDLADGQKIFLLSPRRFGKTSLLVRVLERLKARDIKTVLVPVSSYASYAQFLEKFAEQVIRAAGSWERTRSWVERFIQRVRPKAGIDLETGEISISLGAGAADDPAPFAPEVFALPGELARKGGFRMAVCLDEFQQITEFNGRAVENALRNAVQHQREVGYVFSGSQPSLMQQMLAAKRPFHKAGPLQFLDKIPAADWERSIADKFKHRGRVITAAAIHSLLEVADLIPYDVQRIAHELWDMAELEDKRTLEASDVEKVAGRLMISQSEYFERVWQQLSMRQRAVLYAMAHRGPAEIYSQTVRDEYRLGPASTVQKALQSLDAKDILDVYQGAFFFLDPLFGRWIKTLS